MKITIFSTFSILLAAVTVNAAPRFVQLEASSLAPYANGQAAVLTAHIRIQPTNPNDEIFVSSNLNGPVHNDAQKLTRISDSEAVAITPTLTDAGAYTWHVSVYLQNKVKAAQIDAAIYSTECDNVRIENALQTETDPAIRLNLMTERDSNNDFIGRSRNQLWNDRTGLESDDLVFSVSSAKVLLPFETPVIAIDADHENPTYAVGVRATFFVHALTDFSGPDGIKEILAFANINGNETNPGLPVERRRLGAKDFAFTPPVFLAADVGPRVFNAYLKVRSKAQADSIRASTIKAIQRRSEYIGKRDAAADAEKRAYYTSLIHEMDFTINELNSQLVAILQDVPSSKDFFFSVTTSK
jgi:hypothetical protein